MDKDFARWLYQNLPKTKATRKKAHILALQFNPLYTDVDVRECFNFMRTEHGIMICTMSGTNGGCWRTEELKEYITENEHLRVRAMKMLHEFYFPIKKNIQGQTFDLFKDFPEVKKLHDEFGLEKV